MRLDAIDYDDAVRFKRMPVHEERHFNSAIVESDDFHRGTYRAAHSLFRDSIRGEDFRLTFRRRSAMTAHSRQYERMCSFPFDHRSNRFDDTGNIGNSTTAGGDCNAGPGWNLQIPGSEFSRDSLRCGLLDVGNPEAVKRLTDFSELIFHCAPD